MRDEVWFHEVIISIDWDHFWISHMKDQHQTLGIEYCVYVSLPVHFGVRKEKLDILEWFRLHAFRCFTVDLSYDGLKVTNLKYRDLV